MGISSMRRLLRKPPGDFVAVDIRQANIQDDQVCPVGAAGCYTLFAASSRDYLIAFAVEESRQHFGYVGIVFDDQQACYRFRHRWKPNSSGF